MRLTVQHRIKCESSAAARSGIITATVQKKRTFRDREILDAKRAAQSKQ